MDKTPTHMVEAAIAFAKNYESAANEKRESQNFLRDFLSVFDIKANPHDDFEVGVDMGEGKRGYIDCLIKGKLAIEMKSRGEDLEKAFRQLKGYVRRLPDEKVPELLMVCDFEKIILDIDKKKIAFGLSDLHKRLDLFGCLWGDDEPLRTDEQIAVNVAAAEKMAKLHNAFEACGYSGKELEVYMVRLLYCMFAEDTDIFPRYSFLDYVRKSKKDGSDLSLRLSRLFEMLDMSPEKRKARTNMPQEVLGFQYINGGIFAERLPIADFDAKMRETLIECAEFDWSNISPTVFGAMFQGVMNKVDRRTLGAHYTSEANILKVINPLFMDGLRAEFEEIKDSPKKLDEFHNKISAMKFLDPACGCGNFLIVAYRELRRLELAVLEKKFAKDTQLTFDIMWNLIRVNVNQFYGIELGEFPCQIAQVGMWLTDHQMNLEASKKFGHYYQRLPLSQRPNITHGNALRIDWETIVPKKELSYIFGNPPFVGASYATSEQKADLCQTFNRKKCGCLDYVTAWFKKASDYTFGTNIKCAFVSTNSICQGEQATMLWKPLFANGIKINFAYKSFKWGNEAKSKATVHCVIVGFSYANTPPPRYTKQTVRIHMRET